MKTAMTVEEVLRLPIMITLKQAADAIGMGRTQAYALAKDDHFPIQTERYGNRYRLRRADLLAYLGIGDTPSE